MRKENAIRREEITKDILACEAVKVNELALQYRVTKETIRNDLNFMEQKGLVYRTHGGAVLKSTGTEVPMEVRQQEQNAAKRKIALQAINYIEDHMVIYIDPSSTALPLGRLLRMKKDLTVFTNSYELIPYLENGNHRIILVGGEYWNQGKRTIGSYVTDMLRDVYFDIVVLGMEGCKDMTGPGVNVLDGLAVNKCVISKAKKVMLLADNTKFERTATYEYCDFSQLTYMITDQINERIRNQVGNITLIEACV